MRTWGVAPGWYISGPSALTHFERSGKIWGQHPQFNGVTYTVPLRNSLSVRAKSAEWASSIRTAWATKFSAGKSAGLLELHATLGWGFRGFQGQHTEFVDAFVSYVCFPISRPARRGASAQGWHEFPTSAGSQHQRCASIPAQANGLGIMRHDAEGLKARFIVSNETRN